MLSFTFKLGPIVVCVAAADVQELQNAIEEDQKRRGALGAGVGARKSKSARISNKRSSR